MDGQNLDPYKITLSQNCVASHILEKLMDRMCGKICQSVSQKCVGTHNLVLKWLDFDTFRPVWS